jgi:hypothetical protein
VGVMRERWAGRLLHLQLVLVCVLVSSCHAPETSLPSADQIAGEYRGEVRIASARTDLPISLSLRRDGSFVGDFPDPYITWGGHMRAIGRWTVAGVDAMRGCVLIELAAEGRRARAHCATRERDGQIGLNCSGAGAGRRCAMKKARVAVL